jgi:hypothetical protein
MAMSLILLIGACIIAVVVLGAGGIILAVFLSSQRDQSNNPHE